MLPICCAVLASPDPAKGSLQTAAAVAVSDVGDHVLPWLHQQMTISKDAAIKASFNVLHSSVCSSGLLSLSFQGLQTTITALLHCLRFPGLLAGISAVGSLKKIVDIGLSTPEVSVVFHVQCCLPAVSRTYLPLHS
jgi:hypothetical protein